MSKQKYIYICALNRLYLKLLDVLKTELNAKYRAQNSKTRWFYKSQQKIYICWVCESVSSEGGFISSNSILFQYIAGLLLEMHHFFFATGLPPGHRWVPEKKKKKKCTTCIRCYCLFLEWVKRKLCSVWHSRNCFMFYLKSILSVEFDLFDVWHKQICQL